MHSRPLQHRHVPVTGGVANGSMWITRVQRRPRTHAHCSTSSNSPALAAHSQVLLSSYQSWPCTPQRTMSSLPPVPAARCTLLRGLSHSFALPLTPGPPLPLSALEGQSAARLQPPSPRPPRRRRAPPGKCLGACRVRCCPRYRAAAAPCSCGCGSAGQQHRESCASLPLRRA